MIRVIGLINPVAGAFHCALSDYMILFFTSWIGSMTDALTCAAVHPLIDSLSVRLTGRFTGLPMV